MVVEESDAITASVTNAEVLNAEERLAAADEVQTSDEVISDAVALRTGHFDVGSVKLLRTCSEPDLSRLSRPCVMTSHKSVHHSREGSVSPHDEIITCHVSSFVY